MHLASSTIAAYLLSSSNMPTAVNAKTLLAIATPLVAIVKLWKSVIKIIRVRDCENYFRIYHLSAIPEFHVGGKYYREVKNYVDILPRWYSNVVDRTRSHLEIQNRIVYIANHVPNISPHSDYNEFSHIDFKLVEAESRCSRKPAWPFPKNG